MWLYYGSTVGMVVLCLCDDGGMHCGSTIGALCLRGEVCLVSGVPGRRCVTELRQQELKIPWWGYG